MKKTKLLFTITMFIMFGTGCDNGNLPDILPQSSLEETVSSADPAPESKPDTESLPQEPTSEVTSSAAPAPESKPDTESSGETSETESERYYIMLEGYDCAVAYVGYTKNEDVNSVRECVKKSPTAKKYPFVADIANDKIILAGGGEIYCILPADTSAKITVNSSDHGDELYSGGSAPILISCNVSDIMPNVSVSIKNGDKTLKFSPFLSLRDGRLSLPENLKILDFSEY